MWAPFIHDWEAIKERNELKEKIEEDEYATISVDIPIELFLKLAEQADRDGSRHFGMDEYQNNNIYEVKHYINEILENYIVATKENEEACKVLSKTK